MPTDPDPAVTAPPLLDLGELLGGRRGVVDASVPGVVLVVTDAFGPLGWAIAASVAAAAGIAVLRKVRGEPLRQAAMGLPFLAFCAVLAAFTGQAKTYFLPGILTTAAGALVVTGSLVVRRPLIGFVAATLDSAYAGWRAHAGQRRAAMLATAIWAVVLATRAGVQGYLYTQGHDELIASVRLFMSTPLTVVALAASFYLLQAQRDDARPDPVPAQPGGSGGDPVTS